MTTELPVLKAGDFASAQDVRWCPGCGDYSILAQMKKMLPSMAVIMLTGHGSERAARAGIEEGAYDYLTKPCGFEELLAKIQEAVSREGRNG